MHVEVMEVTQMEKCSFVRLMNNNMGMFDYYVDAIVVFGVVGSVVVIWGCSSTTALNKLTIFM